MFLGKRKNILKSKFAIRRWRGAKISRSNYKTKKNYGNLIFRNTKKLTPVIEHLMTQLGNAIT